MQSIPPKESFEDCRVHPLYYIPGMGFAEMGITLHHLQGFVP